MKLLHEIFSKSYLDIKKERIIYFCPYCKTRRVIALYENKKERVIICNKCYNMIKNTGVILDVNNL